MKSDLTFDQYYQSYLSKHQNKWCRRLHVLGNIVTLTYIILTIIYLPLYFLVLAPFIIYPFAWTGHYMFEQNTPAAFSRPFLAKIADWRMMFDILRGKISL
jgi:hypothetical protein